MTIKNRLSFRDSSSSICRLQEKAISLLAKYVRINSLQFKREPGVQVDGAGRNINKSILNRNILTKLYCQFKSTSMQSVRPPLFFQKLKVVNYNYPFINLI